MLALVALVAAVTLYACLKHQPRNTLCILGVLAVIVTIILNMPSSYERNHPPGSDDRYTLPSFPCKSEHTAMVYRYRYNLVEENKDLETVRLTGSAYDYRIAKEAAAKRALQIVPREYAACVEKSGTNDAWLKAWRVISNQ